MLEFLDLCIYFKYVWILQFYMVFIVFQIKKDTL